MSHRACSYVKKLTHAPCDCPCGAGPSGKPLHGNRKLAVQEKALLMYLADSHNDELRCAWPAVQTLAVDLSLSTRRIQQLITGLCCKGVLLRTERVRPNGSNTSNAYSFPDLDSRNPVAAPKNLFTSPGSDVQRRVKPASSSTCGFSQGAGATGLTEGRKGFHPLILQRTTNVSETGTANLPGNEPSPPTPLEGGVNWGAVLVSLKTQFASVPIKSGLTDEYDKYFRDTWQIRFESSGELILGALDIETAETGLSKYKRRIAETIKNLFGVEISIKLERLKNGH